MSIFFKYALMLYIALLVLPLGGCKDNMGKNDPVDPSGISMSKESKTLDENTNEFICENIFPENSDGKIFCAYKTIKKEENENTITQYLMVVAEEYYLKNNQLKIGTSVLVPVVVVSEKQENKYVVKEFKNPLKYNEGTGEIEELFPDYILKEIDSGNFNDDDTVNYLKTDVKNQAEKFFELN